MLHQLQLQQIAYTKIKGGTKIIESRLYDEKRKLINLGDTLEFHLVDSSDVCRCEVIALLRYPSFSELMSEFPAEYFGWNTVHEAIDEICQFYTKEQQKEHGVLGIKVKLLTNK